MNALEDEWRTVALGELVETARGLIKTGPFGSQLHASEYTHDGTGVPVVMPKDMVNGRIDPRSVSRVSEPVAERLKTHALASGDLVLARRGDIGRLAFVDSDEAGWLCGTGSMRIHAPDHNVLDPRFLRYAMSAPRVAECLAGQAVGATMANLNAAIVSEVPVPVPSIRTQRRIAALLSAVDELIEINGRRIALLEDLARSLYREWFVYFRFPGHEHLGLVDSELGLVPEGWEMTKLADVVTTQYGYTASAEAGHVGPKFLRGMDINKRSYIDWRQVPYCAIEDDDAEKFRLEVGDVCVVRMADPGKVGIVEDPVDAVFASYLVRLRPTEPRLGPYLLFHFMADSRYQDWIGGASTGSTRKSASAKVLTEPPVLIPPRELAEQFEGIVGVLRGQLCNLVRASSHLAETRDLLLPRLVTGKVDISDIDLGILEPAEVD